MKHDAKTDAGPQADLVLAATLQRHLHTFLRSVGNRLAHLLDIRLVLTALEIVDWGLRIVDACPHDMHARLHGVRA